MIRLQGADFYKMQRVLKPYAYRITTNGNICVFYKGGYKHYLSDSQKEKFNPEGLVNLSTKRQRG